MASINTVSDYINNVINNTSSNPYSGFNISDPNYYTVTASPYFHAASNSYDIKYLFDKKTTPTIVKILNTSIEDKKLKIKYKKYLNKFLPDTGTLFLSKIGVYCTFNKGDDIFWNDTVFLTLERNLTSEEIESINDSIAVLINDFDTKLSNEELETITSYDKLKNIIHLTSEKQWIEKDYSKESRAGLHRELEEKLKEFDD